MARSPATWVLTDDRPGNANQALGVAEALGWPYQVQPIGYGPLARLPNWALGGSILGLTTASRTRLGPPWPDLVIAAGRRGAPVVRWLKRRRAAMLTVQLMWPGAARGLDVIAVPEHDRVPDRPGLLRTLGAPHRLTPERLAGAAAALKPRLGALPRPWIACLVGGSTRKLAFTTADARTLALQASALAAARGGSLLVTTSRRTLPTCVAALSEAIQGAHWFHRWTAGGDDLYPGMLGSADAVVVTADSTSMCIEACTAGVPVFVFRPAAGIAPKVVRLHQRLAEQGNILPLGAPWPMHVPAGRNAATTVADEIRRRLTGPIGARGGAAVATSRRTR